MYNELQNNLSCHEDSNRFHKIDEDNIFKRIQNRSWNGTGCTATNKLHVYRIPVAFFRRFKKQTLVTFRDASKRGLLRNPLFFSRIERNPGKCWENECLESTNRDDGRVFVSRVASTRAEFYMLILMHRWFEILRVTAAKHQNIRYSVWSDLRNIRNANRKYVCIFIWILRRIIEIS